jgi:hypothetical protein
LSFQRLSLQSRHRRALIRLQTWDDVVEGQHVDTVSLLTVDCLSPLSLLAGKTN